MQFRYPYFAENIPRLHRAYRSARRSKRPIALVITEYDSQYEDRDMYGDTIRYFTEQREGISDQIYSPERRCVETYAEVIRKEKTCVVVERMIRIEDGKISRFSIRNLETTHDLVHDFITCIPEHDRWAVPEITALLTDIGFHVVLFEFRGGPHGNFEEEVFARAIRDRMHSVDREKEMQIAHCTLSDSTERYTGWFDVPVYLNGVEVYEFHELCEYSDTKAFVCPGCFKAVTFGRDDEAHNYVQTEPVQVFDELDRVSTLRGFAHHARRCHPAFPHDGIFEVVTDQQQYTVKQLALLSRRDGRWDFPLVDDSSFRGDVGTVFVYVRDRVPVSYVAFRRKNVPDHGPTDIIWDLFTLPPYRRQGLATAVLNHGIEELKLDRDYLPVSLPVTEYSEKIVRNASTRCIMDRYGILYDPGDLPKKVIHPNPPV